MAILNFDFGKARSQADQIEEIGHELERLISEEYEQAIQELSASWKGDSADAYLRKAAHLQEKMDKTASAVRSAADSMRATIRIVEAAEEMARQLAEQRLMM